MEPFIHLHVHTQYSLLDGQASIDALIDKAHKDGMRAIAVTDHGVMFGIKEFFNKVNKKNGKYKDTIKKAQKELDKINSQAEPITEEDNQKKAELEKQIQEAEASIFKPIIGCECYCARHGRHSKLATQDDRSGWHLIVLAKNLNGYKNLIKMVSLSWTEGFYGRPRIDKELLEQYHEDLIVCSACLGGEIPQLIMKGQLKQAEESVLWFKNLFGDDYYLEMQRHETHDPNADCTIFPHQQEVNKVLVELAHKHQIKLIATNDVHFVNEEDAEAHDRLICLSTGKDLDDPNRMRYSKQEWFKTREEMNEVFADVPEALSNTLEVLDKVEIYSIDHGPIMPFFPIPESFGTEEQLRQKVSEEDLYREFTTDENGENQLSPEDGQKVIDRLGGYDKIYRIKFEAEYLRHLAYEGARKLYGDPLPENVDEHVNFELHVMKTMGFPGYFLIVSDFIRAAREELGVMVGPGRGSAAGSVVAYCLGITKIDPLKYDLLFERFLNPDRVNLPDIDTDFDDDGRGKVLRWVMDKYGHENCAHIITYGSMATKNSIKDVARVEKLPLDKANALCKAIPDRLPDGAKMNLANAIKYTPELKEAEYSSDPRESNTIKYARMLEGTIRGTGIHACGFIICRDPISNWVPVSTADDPDFPGLKTAVTQYDGHVIETTGLIKMDFLGLKTLSEMKEACKVIKQTTGDVVDLDTIPIDDELTYQLYQRGQTIGTFQFESPGMQKYLRELKPTVFEDLIAMNALYRPGPMDYIPDFIARKNGQQAITYDIPCMEKYLKDTYGITVYQEQVMLLSRQLASFTRGESDALRKAMGKKKKAIVDAMKPKFIKQGQENGHDPAVLEKIWSDWEKFASYAFNKSHATCYSWVAYQTAYLKAHYPAEYMAALMTRRFAQITEITKLMEECQSMDIKTLGPDVNESYRAFGVNEHGEIRFGLSAIKGMGTPAADAIVAERLKNGPYKNIFDFAERVDFSNVNRKAFESLALSGGFDSFGIRREQYFGKNSKGDTFLDTLVRYGQLYQQEQREAATSLFGGVEAVEIATPPIPEAESWSTIERLNRERELVGIYLSAHPLDDYEIILRNLCNTHCSELGDKVELAKKEDVVFGGIITGVKSKFTKTGKPCGFVTIEDFEGSGELALFGEDWGNWRGIMVEGSTIFVTAKCVSRYGNSNFLDFKISTVEYLQTVKENRLEKFTIIVDSTVIDETLVNDIKTLVENDEGKAQLFLQIHDAETKTNVLLRAQDRTVGVSRDLIQFVNDHPKMSYQIN